MEKLSWLIAKLKYPRNIKRLAVILGVLVAFSLGFIITNDLDTSQQINTQSGLTASELANALAAERFLKLIIGYFLFGLLTAVWMRADMTRRHLNLKKFYIWSLLAVALSYFSIVIYDAVYDADWKSTWARLGYLMLVVLVFMAGIFARISLGFSN